MSSHVFILDPADVLDSATLADARPGMPLSFGGPPAHHAASVVRVRPGEVIELVDGAGRRTRAEVRTCGRDQVHVQVLTVAYEPPPDLSFTVIQALVKGAHAELAIDQLTQAGADAIIPWAAQHSVARWDGDRDPSTRGAASRGQRKWQQVATQATMQSRRSRTPTIEPLARTDEVLARVRQASAALVLDAGAAEEIGSVDLPGRGEVVLVVGPEGGVSAAELMALAEAGARPVCLGPEVLRASLAGAVAVAVLSARHRWPVERMPGGRTADGFMATDGMGG